MPPNDYTTLASVKALMPDTAWGTSYDTVLGTLITRASRIIDGLLGREPGSFAVGSDVTKYFDGSGCLEQWIGELAALPTSVSVAETGVVDDAAGSNGTYTLWANRDYRPWPYNNLAEGKPILRLDIDLLSGAKQIWYSFPKAVKVVGKFGFATTSNTPSEIVQAAEIQTVRWFKRAQQTFQDAGAIVELGQLRYVKKLDPDVENVLMKTKFQWL